MRISERLLSLSLVLVIASPSLMASDELEISQGIKEWSDESVSPEIQINQELASEMQYLKEGLENTLEKQDNKELEQEIAALLEDADPAAPETQGENLAENVSSDQEIDEVTALLKEEFPDEKVASLEIPDGDQVALSEIINTEDDQQFEDRVSSGAAGLLKKSPSRSPAIPKSRRRSPLPSDVEELLDSHGQKETQKKALKRSR